MSSLIRKIRAGVGQGENGQSYVYGGGGLLVTILIVVVVVLLLR